MFSSMLRLRRKIRSLREHRAYKKDLLRYTVVPLPRYTVPTLLSITLNHSGGSSESTMEPG